MAGLVLTNVYLEDTQKKALAKKAKADGTNISAEMRRAVDVYLAGMNEDDLRLLDEATKQAKVEIDEMNQILDNGLKRANKFFAEIEALKAAA
ncbi:MAG: hypothetical protein HZA59_12540 [Hydrogenophilales bacterium]|nr:hypothetical protein [Hydrogenophilales bacterium]